MKNKKLTFSFTYKKLINELEKFIYREFKKIINNDYTCYKTNRERISSLQISITKNIKNLGSKIFLKTGLEYSLKKEKIISDKLKILDKIEETRKSNNVNWMNILRNGIKNSTNQTLDILKMINQDDKRISKII